MQDEKVAALVFNAKVMDQDHEREIKRVRLRVKYHQKLIILHEILNDVITYKTLKDPDSAKDYQEKLGLFNQRRQMINFLNQKYGAGSKTFLEILEAFKSYPHKILQEPHPTVKRLISETFEKINRERQ